jgi:hypothetical protein
MNFKKLLFFISFFSFSFGTSLSAQLYINEIMVQPPSSGSSAKQDNEELIEIRGVANSTIADNTYLIQVEGDSNDPGDIESSSNNAGGIIDLSGKTIGSNGTLVILTTGHPYTISSETTQVLDVTDGNLEDPTHTFFLINTNGNSVEDDGGTSRSAPHSNHDLDENNDGIIDTKFTSAWTFMDGISIIDNDDSNEYGYAEVIFSKKPSNSTIYKSSTATLVDTSNQQFRYFARIGNSTGYKAGEVADADWVGGTINSGDNPNLSSSDYWSFGSNSSGIRALPEAWEGYELNHLGAPNPTADALSIKSFDDPNDFILYPNPTNAMIHISGKESVDAISLYNISGQLIMKATNTSTLDVGSQQNGLYIKKSPNKINRQKTSKPKN